MSRGLSSLQHSVVKHCFLKTLQSLPNTVPMTQARNPWSAGPSRGACGYLVHHIAGLFFTFLFFFFFFLLFLLLNFILFFNWILFLLYSRFLLAIHFIPISVYMSITHLLFSVTCLRPLQLRSHYTVWCSHLHSPPSATLLLEPSGAPALLPNPLPPHPEASSTLPSLLPGLCSVEMRCIFLTSKNPFSTLYGPLSEADASLKAALAICA